MEQTEKQVTISVQMKTGYMFDFLYWHSYSGVMGIVNYGLSLAAVAALVAGFGKGNPVATVALLVLSLLFTVINPLLLLQKQSHGSREDVNSCFIAFVCSGRQAVKEAESVGG